MGTEADNSYRLNAPIRSTIFEKTSPIRLRLKVSKGSSNSFLSPCALMKSNPSNFCWASVFNWIDMFGFAWSNGRV